MVVQQGCVDVGGTIAYVPQTPWVQNLSLRDNILFGMPYDEAKYKKVIHACALELDLKILPNGKHHSLTSQYCYRVAHPFEIM
jgi:ABC-type multidrug transport system fused ATPase/permease subunit